jgi:CHASE1-domain containing sensor protein
MKQHLSLQSSHRNRTWIPYFVLLVTLLLTTFATYYVARTAKAKEELRFEKAVQSTQEKIENRLDTYITLLRATSGLFAADDC